MIVKLGRYWNTLRHLKPVQVYGRLWFRYYRPRLDIAAAEPPIKAASGLWCAPVARRASMLGPFRFRFLNIEQSLPSHGGWNDPLLDKLWLYNLHYFDDLNAIDADLRVSWHQALIERWVSENLPCGGNGWEPYPTSLRIVNWVKWLNEGHDAPEGMAQSLATQLRWLSKRLECHLLGNHLFANAKALVFGGLLFDGKEAAGWLARGLSIVQRELVEQVLPDGGNFERSTMYHALFLEDVLDLINADRTWPDRIGQTQVGQCCNTALRMLDWLEGMSHPDGEIAFFNDAAFGVGVGVAVLRSYASRLGLDRCATSQSAQHGEQLYHTSNQRGTGKTPRKLISFKDSGYVRMEMGDAIALIDVAPVGPDYLPGHAHADTLSFELSVFGQRVVVNGGTSRYGLGAERLRERGTAAHSTVQVAGEDSSEVWSGFRVARRAYPFDLQVCEKPEAMSVACSHDGYTRLRGTPIHRRQWLMQENSLRITDTVSGGKHAAHARYILHPGVKVDNVDIDTWQLSLPNAHRLKIVVLNGRARWEPASYAPEFGVVLPTQCLVVELEHGEAMVEWSWS